MFSPGLANEGYVFWAGDKSENGDDTTRPFWIKNDGSFKANRGTIADWTVEPYRLIGPPIQETNDAKAYSRVGMSAVSGHGSWAFWAGGHPDENGGDIAYGSKSKFHVGHSGELYADTAYITNQGQIGVFNLVDGYLETPNLRFGDFRDPGTDQPIIGLLMRSKDKINSSWAESGADLQIYADKDMNSIIPNLKTINLHATSLSVNSFTAPGGIIFGKHQGYPCLGIGSINNTKGMAIGIRFVSLGLNSGNLRLYISPTGSANNNNPTGFTTYVKLYYNDFDPVDNRRILGPQEDIIIKIRYIAAADGETRYKEIKFSSLLNGSEWYDSSIEYVVQSDTVSTDWTRKGIAEIVITELSWYSYSENQRKYFDTNNFYMNWVESPGNYSSNHLNLTDTVKKDSDYRLEAFKQDEEGNVTTAVILQ